MRLNKIVKTAGVLSLAFSMARPVVAQSGLPWASDFESGDFSVWNAGATTGFTPTSQGCAQGQGCVRASLVAGTHSDNYADHNFGDHFRVGGDKVEEVYLSVYSKFGNGYVWPNDSQKIAILNLTNGVDRERRYQVYLYVNRLGQYAVDYSYWEAWRFFGLAQNVGVPLAVRPDQWDRLKLYVRLNSPGIADGIVRLWVNGELKLAHTNVNIREGTGYGINKLNLSSYATDASGSDGVQWYDQWTLTESDPDLVRPMPVTALTVR